MMTRRMFLQVLAATGLAPYIPQIAAAESKQTDSKESPAVLVINGIDVSALAASIEVNCATDQVFSDQRGLTNYKISTGLFGPLPKELNPFDLAKNGTECTIEFGSERQAILAKAHVSSFSYGASYGQGPLEYILIFTCTEVRITEKA